MLPKEGGNAVRGTFFAAGVTERHGRQQLHAGAERSRADDARRDEESVGLQPRYRRAVGEGPRVVLREPARGRQRAHRAGHVRQRQRRRPTKWTYVADTNRPAVLAASYRITALRLTAQATPRNKFTVFWDQQRPCEGGAAPGFSGDACRKSGDDEIFAGSTAAPTPSASAIAAPETAAYRDYGNRVAQAKWTSPVNNRLLLESGFGMYLSRYGGGQLPGLPTEDLIRVVEQCAPSCANNGNIPGLSYRSLNWFSNVNWNNQWNAAASLVTGSHSIKFGYQGALLIDQRKNFGNNEFLQYRVNNAIPDQITLNINRFGILQSVRSDAFYVQEQWTLGRMTMQGAMRYDHAWSYFPEQTVGPVRFFPTAVTYPRTTGVEGYHDLWPRGGVAYDVFGTGKTSIKVNFGRYLEAAQNGGLFIALNPTGRLSTTTTRTWTDDDRNYVADCNLSNPAAQGPENICRGGTMYADRMPARTSGRRSSTRRWTRACCRGGACVRATGSGVRRCSRKCSRASPSKWDTSAGGSSTPSPPITARGRPTDHTVFGVTIPTDSRLPDGGGGVLDGLYNVTPEAALRLTDNYRDAVFEHRRLDAGRRTRVNVNVTARMRNGLVLQGGFNTGTNSNDYCGVRSAIPEWTVVLAQSPTNPWCDTSSGWVTRVTALGSDIDSEDRRAGLRHAAQRSRAASSPRTGRRRTRPPSA